MAVIGSATLNVVPKVEGGLANAINQEISKANVSGIGKSAGSSFMGGFTSGAAIGIWSTVATKAINAVTNSLGGAVSRVDTLNNYPRIMESLGVASEDATASMQKMSTNLDNVPTRLDDMANTVQGIYAATLQYGTSLDTVTDAGLALNSMLLAGGQSQAVVTSAMEQFRQAVAKGKPDMQDWRSLMSAAPGQLDQLAKALVGPTAGALDLYAALGGGKESEYSGPAEWGSISMGQFVESLASMREQFEGAATDAQGGIGTAFANMKNAVTKGVANVLDAFGQERISSAIGDIKGLINDAFGRSDTEGLRAFAVEIAPMFSDAWDSMIGRVKDFEGAVGPSVARVGEALVKTVGEFGPAVGDAIGSVMDAVADAAPTVADTLTTIIEVGGEAIGGVADIVSGIAPVVSQLAQDVLPVVGDVVESVGPALPAIMVANTALGTLSTVAGGLSAAGTGISAVAGALGAVGSVLPMVGGLADVGPALSLIAESGKLMGASGVVGAIGGVATAIADVVPMIGGLADVGPALALVAESGGGLLAAVNPLPLLLGAAAAGVGVLGFKAYSAWRDEKQFADSIQGVVDVTRNMDSFLGAGIGAIDGFSGASRNAKVDIDGLVRAMDDYAKKSSEVHDAAYEEIGMLEQYKRTIDDAAKTTSEGGELSAEGMAKLQWAVDGLNEAAGTHFTVEEVIAGSYEDEQGEIHNTIEAIDELIAKRQEEARTQALQDTLTESYKLQMKAATELADAQEAAAPAFEVINSLMRDQNLSYEQAYDAVMKSGGAMAQHLSDLEHATEAYDAATGAVKENERALGNAAAATGEASGALAEWVNGHSLAANAVASTNMDMESLVATMEQAGISTQQLDAMGEASFAQLASACNGDVNTMVNALQAYNSQPIYEKDGKVQVDQSVLFDALGNIYTWNGERLVDQNGFAYANDKELTDAYGNVVVWNNTEAKAITANIKNTSNPIPTLLGQLSTLASYNGLNVTTNVTNTTRNVTVNETQYKSSGSPTKATVATGGHAVPRHASGYIAYGPTRTSFGLVGEDGVEAVYNNDDGTSDVYPLNNPRYLSYADPLAERIASVIGQKSLGGGPTYIIEGIIVSPESAMARAMDATFDEARRYAGMGRRR